MIITYHDGYSVRVSAGDTALVFGPVSRQSKRFKPVNFGTDIALVPALHPDVSGGDEAGRGEKQPFVVFGPGEYELKEVTVFGYASKASYDDTKLNTIYDISFDGLSVLYLGLLNEPELPKEVLEMDEPDILLVPVSAETLSPADAWRVAVQLEAKIVIPLSPDEKLLKQFLKEAGAEGTKPTDKLTLKPRDVAGKENEVVVLAA